MKGVRNGRTCVDDVEKSFFTTSQKSKRFTFLKVLFETELPVKSMNVSSFHHRVVHREIINNIERCRCRLSEILAK